MSVLGSNFSSCFFFNSLNFLSLFFSFHVIRFTSKFNENMWPQCACALFCWKKKLKVKSDQGKYTTCLFSTKVARMTSAGKSNLSFPWTWVKHKFKLYSQAALTVHLFFVFLIIVMVLFLQELIDKLHRQARVEEEVKHVLKAYYKHRDIDKEEYKDILRKAVPQVCHRHPYVNCMC